VTFPCRVECAPLEHRDFKALQFRFSTTPLPHQPDVGAFTLKQKESVAQAWQQGAARTRNRS
jgi:hypothetical protein